MKKRIGSILLSLVMCLTLLPTAALADTAESGAAHTNHCVCGATHSNVGDHNSESKITDWQAWDTTDSLPDTAGNYYLTDNVVLSETWKPANDTVLCLNGKSITYSNSSAVGDVISVGTGIVFTLTDCQNTGIITHDSESKGRGVYVYKTNTVNAPTSFYMYGGTITGNNNNDYGGGVYIYSQYSPDDTKNYYPASFDLYGGTISNNTGVEGGGVFLSSNSSFFQSEFNMYGGSISGNTASASNYYTGEGGGVCIFHEAKFVMRGGTISGNKAVPYSKDGKYYCGDGGGVYVGCEFTMTGGSITGNSVTENSDGGGVYVSSGTKMTVSGTVNITGNKKGTADNNVYLPKDTTITIEGSLNKSARIGVTTKAEATAENPVKIATNASTSGTNVTYTKIFTPDEKAKYSVSKTGTDLYFVPHTHSYTTYIAGGATITAVCVCGDENGGTVTIVVPAELTYDGSSKTATLEKNNWKGETVKNSNITYTKDGAAFYCTPRAAGSYTAGITVGGQTAFVTYEVIKATPEAADFTFTAPTDLTYDGTAKSAVVEVKDDINGMGSVTVKYFKEDGTPVSEATDVGTYIVKIDVAEGTNYAAANLTADDWKFTIGKATPTATDFIFTAPTDPTYDGSAKSVTIEAKDGISGMGSITVKYFMEDGTLVSEATDVGTYTVEIDVAEGTNYTAALELGAVDWKFTIGKAAPAAEDFTFTAPADLTYDGNAKFATVEVKDSISGMGGITVKYFKEDGTPVSEAVDAGTYTVKINVAEGTGYAAAADLTAEDWTFTIGKATPVATDFVFTAPSDLIYDGTAKSAQVEVEDTISGMGSVSVKYFKEDGTPVGEAKNAGNYIVKIDVAEGTNYAAANLTADAWRFTIGKAAQTITVPEGENAKTIAKGKTEDISAWATVAGVIGGSDPGELSYELDGEMPGVSLTDNKLTTDSTVSVGATISVKVTAAATGNYNEADRTFTVTVVELPNATVNTAPAAVENLTYNGAPQVLVTAGTSDTGRMEYRLGENGTWSTNLPKATDADTYTVYYKASGDGTSYLDSGVGSVEVTIAPKTLTRADLVCDQAPITKTYDGTDACALTEVSVKDGVLCGSDTLNITGTAVYDSANVYEASKVIFTPNAITGGNYRLAATETLEIPADITPLHVTPEVTVSGETLIYDGTGKRPAVTVEVGDTVLVGDTDYTVSYGNNINAGENTASVTVTAKAERNYTWTAATENFSIAKGELPESSYPADLNGYKGRTLSTVELPAGWTWVDGDAVLSDEGAQTFAANYAGTDNYNPKNGVQLTVNVSEKEPKSLTVGMTGWTYGEVSGTPTFATAADAGAVSICYKPQSAADSAYTATVPTDAGDYTVRVSYETATEIWSGTAHFTIAKATPTGAPKYTAITATGKTLADAMLTTEGGTFSVPGTVQWVDSEGNELPADTEVTARTAYRWLFTPADSANYNTIEGTVTLWSRTQPGGFVIPTIPEIPVTPPAEPITFIDVKEDAYYAEAVSWAVENGIAVGVGNDLFDPDGSCTRAQIVTFLWRAAGQPVVNYAMPFTDVDEDDYFCEAVRWAASVGITKGTSASTFSPDAVCTRAQVAALIYRMEQANGGGFTGAWMFRLPFTDVPEWCYEAVAWCYMNEITCGVGGDRFGPALDCTRAQIVTMLYRLLSE